MGCMILIEGLDLAGKSTLVRTLQRHFEARGEAVRVANGQLCPENPVAQVAREMVRWDEDFGGDEAGALFLASHLWDGRHYQEFDGVHLQDSSWLRSLAFEKVLGRTELAALMEEHATGWPPFTLSLVLTADMQARARRYYSRAGANDLHDRFAFKHPEKFLAIEAKLVRLCQKWSKTRVLDTSRLSAGQVLAWAVEQIEEVLPLAVPR